MSAGLLADTSRYFASLTAYHQGNPEEIVLLGEVAFRGIAEAQWLMSAAEERHGLWREHLVARQDALSRKVLEELPRQSVLSASAVEQRFKASSTAARRALEQLQAAGIIREFTGRKRSRLWVVTQITDLFDRFPSRAVRRTFWDWTGKEWQRRY